MLSSSQVLVLSNQPELLNYVCSSVRLGDHQVAAAGSVEGAIEQIGTHTSPALIFIDLEMPSRGGLQNLERLRLAYPRSKMLAVCSTGDTHNAVDAIRSGADDCVVRPFSKRDFQTIDRCLGPLEPPRRNCPQVEDVGEGYRMVTSSPAMRKIRSYCDFVAKVDLPVLILGESGTGKEVVARLIHKISSRANRPFLKVNCAAMPADLLESELFGYEPGAFTGATQSKPGKFEQCNKGTIFLDEVGELHPSLQAKLLHVLQDQQFSRLGGRSVVKVDVRVLAATNINISEALAMRQLREDLYYRLNTFVVRMPPLRERKDEIVYLLEHFAKQLARQWGTSAVALSPALAEACKNYPWPGNVRELENFAKRWQLIRDEEAAMADIALSAQDTVSDNHVRARSLTADGSPVERKTDYALGNLKSVARSAMGEAEAAVISKALTRTHWNRKRAAELLDISYKALLYKIKQYDLERSFSASAD